MSALIAKGKIRSWILGMLPPWTTPSFLPFGINIPGLCYRESNHPSSPSNESHRLSQKYFHNPRVAEADRFAGPISSASLVPMAFSNFVFELVLTLTRTQWTHRGRNGRCTRIQMRGRSECDDILYLLLCNSTDDIHLPVRSWEAVHMS